MKAEGEEGQQQSRDHEVGYLRETVGTEGEPTGPGARRVLNRVPSDSEHEVILEHAQREQDAPEQDWPDSPRNRCCHNDRLPLRLEPRPDRLYASCAYTRVGTTSLSLHCTYSVNPLILSPEPVNGDRVREPVTPAFRSLQSIRWIPLSAHFRPLKLTIPLARPRRT